MKATIVEIFKRLTKFEKGLGVITNGVDNLYPERAERFILNSVTAKTASGIMASYLSGKGLTNGDNEKVDDKGTTLKKLSQQISKSFSKQRGAFIHVNYNANFEESGYKVLPYTDCRLGKKDDNDYNGKIVVYDGWDSDTSKRSLREGAKTVDVYNPNPKVIEAQVRKASKNKDGVLTAEDFSKYKGQIWYVNLDDEFTYSLSQIDSVMNDCDSESQAAVFKNRSLRRGFFGKTLIVTKPLSGNLEDYKDAAEYQSALSERDEFKNTIESFVGAEDTGGVLHLEMDNGGDSLEEAIKFENISSDINDKLFEYTEKSVFQNILVSFNNIPMGLVRSDNALFSASGEALQVMKESYQENTSLERSVLDETINHLAMKLSSFKKESHIIPLIAIKPIETEGEV